MAKGLFTQGVCVLLREPMSLAEVRKRLLGFDFVGIHEAAEDPHSPETLVLKYEQDSTAHLLITPSNAPWPDNMGDPDESPELFVAWSLGQLGPLAFPGCLERAAEQCSDWDDAQALSQGHTAHVRVLVSYVLGVDEDEDAAEDEDMPLLPEDYDPVSELNHTMRAVSMLMESPQAICYFNPGGEVLRDQDGLRKGLNQAWSHDVPPLDIWANIRVFRAEEGWVVLDTVGNEQLDLPDIEVICEDDRYELTDLRHFLRSATLYMLSGEHEVEDEDTTDGPGGATWRALECTDSLSDPPRPTIRWMPEDGTTPPEHLLYRGEPGIDMDDELLLDGDLESGEERLEPPFEFDDSELDDDLDDPDNPDVPF